VAEAECRSASTEAMNRPTGNRPDTAHLLLVLAACDAALEEMFHRRTQFREAIEHFRNALADLRAAGETHPAVACGNDTGPPSRNHDSGDASNASEADSYARACARGRNDKQGHADSCFSAPDLLGAGGIEREAARVTERVDPARALDLFKGSIGEIERMRRSLAEDRLKTSFVLDKTRVYDAAVSQAAGLNKCLDAFALMERAKGQAFVDSLKVASGAGGTEVQGDGSAEAWDTAADPLSFAAAVLTVEKAVDAILEYYLLPKRLLVFVATAPGPAAARRVSGHKPRGLADPGEVQTDLITVAVDMSAVDDLVAWLYTDVEVIQSAPASFVATNMAQFLASWNDHARALYDVLIAPLGDRIAGRRRLLVVPHGPLHHVPFHALHDGRRYLVDSHETFFAPSLGALEAIWRKGHRTVRTCIANGAKDEAAPLAEEECARIARLFGPGNARLVVGGDATVNALSQNAEGFDVVHVAGHSVFDPQDPMRSHIRLADGNLSALDLFQMRIACALVMLSACQTGVAYVSSGDELLGLSRGVFHAGASSLAASLWKVNDEATVDLAVEFYRALLAGRTKPEALRRAALRTRSRLRHPYYWAPFVLLGDPGPA